MKRGRVSRSGTWMWWIVAVAAASSGAVWGRGETVTVVVDEGTNIAATLSPDKAQLIMDLQGVLWGLPIEGGAAIRLTDDFLEPARPAWSPKGDRVVFEAYAGGTFHIWSMNPDGTDVTRLTDGHYDDREPR